MTEITINNRSKRITEIHIEGIIGVLNEKEPGAVTTHQQLKEAIQAISEIKTKTILVHIRSTGGNVNDALLIHDTLVSMGCEIITRCYGYVASAATIIAQAASKGKREISKNALYLIHQSSSPAEGNSGELAQAIELLRKTDERIAAIYAEKSGKSPEDFATLMQENGGNGRWMTPQEALNAGLADRIIAPAKIPERVQDQVRELKLPEIPENQSLNPNGIRLKKQWKAVLDFLGIPNGKETVLDENQLERINGEFGKRAQAIAELEQRISRYENPAETEEIQKIADLQNRIVELEAVNAKLKAKATQTFPKEDPSTREFKREANAEAYENDLKNFKNH